jgi:hypothetical protein
MGEDLKFEAHLGKISESLPPTQNKKALESIAQVVKCLPRKWEALGSISQHCNKTQNKIREYMQIFKPCTFIIYLYNNMKYNIYY